MDVAVVGGGFAGVTAAFLLKRAGKKVALLEGRRVAGGDSGLSTAHLTQILDRRYHEIASSFGRRSARLAADTHRIATDRIEEWVRDLEIDCGFERVPGYLYTELKDEVPRLRKECRALQRLGVDAAWIHRPFLPFMQAQAAIRVPDQAQLDPRAYLLALARLIPGNGSHVFEGSHVERFTDAEPCELFAAHGRVLARDVFFATHAAVGSPYRLAAQTAAYRTYVLAAEIDPAESLGGLFWDTADPYHYVRTQAVHGRQMLIVGGEDHKTGTRDTGDCLRRLEDYARARFKGIRSVPYRWSGQVFEPVDGLAYIGHAPSSKRHYVATGFSGNGTTYGTIAGMIVSDLILGRGSPWAGLYDPGRIKPLASIRTFVSENKDYPLCWLRDRVAAPALPVAEIARGEGGIAEVGGKKAAVYRDEAGRIHAVSAVCTHLGCHVRFNTAEKSWDCPCHGSRFDTSGAVLSGPATRALAPVHVAGVAEEERPAEEREKAPGTAA